MFCLSSLFIIQFVDLGINGQSIFYSGYLIVKNRNIGILKQYVGLIFIEINQEVTNPVE